MTSAAPQRAGRATTGPRRTRTVGELVDVAALEPDGLVVTNAGVYVRVIECQHVPNVVSADPSVLAQVEAGWAELCAAIGDLQGLSFYAQTDPIGVTDAMLEDRTRVDLAIDDDRAHDRPGLAQCRTRLLQAQTQSVTQAAQGEQPAVAARYWVAVPYRPAPNPVRALKQTWTPAHGVLRMTWAEHQRAARESLALTEQVIAHLTGMAVDAHLMGPVEILAAAWERLHPTASSLPDLEAFDRVAQIVQATSAQDATRHRASIIDALCSTDEPVGVDTSDPRWLRHADGTLEETLHLGTPPALTSPWWLTYLLQVPVPSTVAVHIRVGDRSRTRSAHRRRWARLRAAIDYKDRRGRLVGHDESDALAEASELDSELAGSIAATVYDVSIYASFRHPGGDEDELDELLRGVAKTFTSFTDARVLRGRFLSAAGLTSTLPIGVDRLRATRRYAHRNIGHCVPLATSSCGCPHGLILGCSDPGGTLERIDPFDALFERHVTLVAGPSGGGKTVAVNALLERAISQGMRGWIVDRSSTRSQDGTRTQSHYDPLLSLIPAARRIDVGNRGGDVICPWDVPKPSDVPSSKLEFLLALHALLIGDLHGDERRLSALEESLLRTAISAVYERCAETGERPRETLLAGELPRAAERLPRAANTAELDPQIASAVHSLVARLAPYVEGGSLAHIADDATTIDPDPPLTLFDIAGASDRLMPALVLTIVDHIDTIVQSTRARHVSGTLDDLGPWAGRRFLVIEEGWRLTSTRASGAWLNEYARRSRHFALWLIFVTQHFKDMANEQGRALLENSALRLCFRNSETDLEHARHPLGLTDTDIQAITGLQTRKGAYSTVYVVSPRGRGRVRITLGDLEYWICSNDPDRDQPARTAALTDADGDPWQALRLLCTPAWHDERRQRAPAR
ncbi:MAG: VirB4 family type IV secretion system protein [Solirubrobacteraceae bacterium]